MDASRLQPDGLESRALCLSFTNVKTPRPTSEFFSPDPKKAFERETWLSSSRHSLDPDCGQSESSSPRRGTDGGSGNPGWESPAACSEGLETRVETQGLRRSTGDCGLEPGSWTGRPWVTGSWVTGPARRVGLRTPHGRLLSAGYLKEGGQLQLHLGSVSKL